MKKITLISGILLIIITFFAGCAVIESLKPGGSSPDSESPSSASDPASSETSEVAEGVSSGIVTYETDDYEYNSEYIEVKLEVPQFAGLKDSAVQDSINKIFADIMTEAKNGFKAAEEESKQLAEERGSVIPYMTYISYSVPYNKDGILSILMSNYTYLGGAHGNDIWSAYTFDLNTGKQLSLDDLMNEESGYRDMINSSIRAEIDRRTETNILLENAAFEDIGDDPAYYLTPDAIVLYFQQYEYFPYAAGIQEFQIKYEDLTGMLKQEYAALTIVPVMLDNTADNVLSAGDTGQVALNGNPTTGYSWHYAISDSSILESGGEAYQSESADADGAGGTYIYDFRALKPGTATITFKYYAEWMDESDAAPEDNVIYTVTVK